MNRTDVGTTRQPIDAVTREIPGTLRAVAVGCSIGVTSVFVAVGGALYLNQRDIALAVALGGMSAIWGGLGFGAMFGGTLHLVRHSDEPLSSTNMIISENANSGRESTEVPASGKVIDVPTAGSAHVSDARTPNGSQAAEHSTQVA